MATGLHAAPQARPPWSPFGPHLVPIVTDNHGQSRYSRENEIAGQGASGGFYLHHVTTLPRWGSRVRIPSSARASESAFGAFHVDSLDRRVSAVRRGGRVVRQRSAKPRTAVQFRSPPLLVRGRIAVLTWDFSLSRATRCYPSFPIVSRSLAGPLRDGFAQEPALSSGFLCRMTV